MEQWKSALIEQVTSSPAYPARTLGGNHQEVLLYLAEHSARADRRLRRSSVLEALFPMNRGAASYLERLDLLLKKFFESPAGRLLSRQIEIVHGEGTDDEADRYAIRFPLNKRALGWMFWRRYLERKYPTFIAYGLPLFLRNNAQTKFTRYYNVNDDESVKAEGLEGETCHPFVAAGDLLAAFACNRYLSEQRVTVDFKAFNAKDGMEALEKATDLQSNVIAVGSKRVSGILDLYQCDVLRKASRKYLPFRLELDYVTEVDDEEREVGDRYRDIRRRKITSVPVVVTRRTGIRNPRNAVTLIASNHGRAVARAAEILTTEEGLGVLFENERLHPWHTNAVPANFQILLRIDVHTDERTAGAFEVQDVWPLTP